MRGWLGTVVGPWILRRLGVDYPERPALELIEGSGVSISVADDPSTEATKVTFSVLGALVGVRGGVKAPIFGELQTSAAGASATPLASYTMVDESICAFDVVVTMARQTNVTKGGRYKRSVAYRRTAGGAPAIVGAIETGTDQETTAGDDVTINVSGNIVRVIVTAADADPRNWTCELRVQETLAT